MPTASDELRAEWPGWDSEAIAYLESKGYTYSRDGSWSWTKPTPNHRPTKREVSAMQYLIDEWDWVASTMTIRTMRTTSLRAGWRATAKTAGASCSG